MEEKEENEWGPKGQPSASEQLKLSGYTEETEYPEPNWEANIQNELSKPKNEQLNSGIAANDPLVDSLLIGAPLLAKPALMKGLMIGGGNLIKKYPLRALEVGLTGLGASDYKDNPQDLVLETLGMKTDTMVSGGKRGPFNPVANLGIKKITELIEDVFSDANSIFNRKLAAEGVGGIDNAKPFQSKSNTPSGGGQLEIPGLSGYGQIEIPGLGTAYGQKTRFWFPWELNKKNTRPRAKYGDIINIEPRYWKKKKNNVIRKNVTFQKVEELDLSNGFIPTKNHPTFNDYILDLIEADKIPARNINPGDLQLRAKAKGTDLELYQDYLAGYFNTHDTLAGATKVTLGKTPKGNVKYFFPSKDIPKVDRVMKIYKLAPEAFHSKYAKGGNINPQAFLADMAQSSTIDDFLAKNFKWQGHHKYIINDAFALIKGLPMHEVKKMRKLMKDSGIKLGNDPKNITFVPQKYHQGFIHNFLWGTQDKAGYKPRWAGNGAEAKQLQAIIAKIPTAEGRIKYVNEFAESMETINDMFDIMVDNFKATKGQHWINKQPSVKDWRQFMDEITAMDYDAMQQIGMPHEGGINIDGKQTFKTPFTIEDETFGAGRMQDDL